MRPPGDDDDQQGQQEEREEGEHHQGGAGGRAALHGHVGQRQARRSRIRRVLGAAHLELQVVSPHPVPRLVLARDLGRGVKRHNQLSPRSYLPLPLDVLGTDAAAVVVDMPAGLPHPGAGQPVARPVLQEPVLPGHLYSAVLVNTLLEVPTIFPLLHYLPLMVPGRRICR